MATLNCGFEWGALSQTPSRCHCLFPGEIALYIDPCPSFGNRHRGRNSWWQLGNSYESNKKSLRHKTRVSRLLTSHLPPHNAQGYSQPRDCQTACFSDEHLSPLRPLQRRINRGDRQSFCITSLTIALHISYHGNRLPAPAHIHFFTAFCKFRLLQTERDLWCVNGSFSETDKNNVRFKTTSGS